MTIINYTKPSSLLVYDLINLANPGLPATVNANNTIIEKITAVQPSAATNNRNTSARLRGLQGSGFRDAVTLYYDRIDLAKVIPNVYGSKAGITSYTATSLHGALPLLLDKFGVNLGTMDIVNAALSNPSVSNYTSTVGVTAQTTSPAYRGTTSIRYYRGLPSLATAIVSNALSVMSHPIDPLENKKSIDMLTYGIDFTAYKNLLTVTSAGLPNWSGLRNLLDSLGVPTYSAPLNSNTVQDVPTSSAQYANKDYDRVVIQTGIDENGVKGKAYYHYNN